MLKHPTHTCFLVFNSKSFSVSNANIVLCRSLSLASCTAQSLFITSVYYLFTIENKQLFFLILTLNDVYSFDPLDLRACANSPCLNGGTCTVTSHGYTCTCSPFVLGQNCEQG